MTSTASHSHSLPHHHSHSSSSHSHQNNSAHPSSSSSSLPLPSTAGVPAPAAAPSLLPVTELNKKITNFEVWMLDCLIRLYVQPNQKIAEFCSGNGIVLSRLMVDLLSPSSSSKGSSGENAFGLSQYYALEGDVSSAKNKWINKDTPFRAEFIETDVVVQQVPTSEEEAAAAATAAGSSSSDPSSSSFIPPHSLDAIFCVKSLARCGGSRTALRCFLSNVARTLKIGGFFIGTLFDTATIWYKITKKERESGGPANAAASKKTKQEKGEGVSAFGPGYRIDFPHLSRPVASFVPFQQSCKFYFQLTEPNPSSSSSKSSSSSSNSMKSFPPFSSFILHLPSLVSEARHFGLQVASLQNCADFLNEHGGAIDEFEQTLRKLSLNNANTNQQIMDVVGLNMMFVFKKVAHHTPTTSTATTLPTNAANPATTIATNAAVAMEE